jgi:hypothetical protein
MLFRLPIRLFQLINRNIKLKPRRNRNEVEAAEVEGVDG